MPTEENQTFAALSEKDRVQILLAEYTSLRGDVVQRANSAYQLTTVVVAAAAVVLSQHWSFAGKLEVAGFFSLFLLCIWLHIIRDMGRSTRRLRTLEAAINKRCGEDLLSYQTPLSAVWQKIGLA